MEHVPTNSSIIHTPWGKTGGIVNEKKIDVFLASYDSETFLWYQNNSVTYLDSEFSCVKFFNNKIAHARFSLEKEVDFPKY